MPGADQTLPVCRQKSSSFSDPIQTSSTLSLNVSFLSIRFASMICVANRGTPTSPSRLEDRDGVVAITIEGKADESFDRPVSVVLQSAIERISADKGTGAILRVEALSAALWPPWRTGLAHLGDLRYQLLTGIAGTLAWAREIGATRAVFAVHEFVTDRSTDDKHAQNASDLNVFLERLSDGGFRGLSAGVLAGPFRVPGSERIPSLPLYVGKAVRTTRVVR